MTSTSQRTPREVYLQVGTNMNTGVLDIEQPVYLVLISRRYCWYYLQCFFLQNLIEAFEIKVNTFWGELADMPANKKSLAAFCVWHLSQEASSRDK